MDQNPNSTKADRKTIEKNRRNQMKALYSQLTSLVPHQAPRVLQNIPFTPFLEMISVSDQLEGATNYIKKLQVNLEKMKLKKKCLMGVGVSANSNSSSNNGGAKLQNVDVRVKGSALEVVLITGLINCQFMFSETIRVIHEEGADVVSASFSLQDNTVFHTIHSKIGDCGQEYVATRISERLRKFVV
ncbi:hypothetical protein BUALT_Bualt03G0056500 [Buddleja alternifolia]|uniref:BHLH domain-containing protein n=1 Tax=Buddleja alternifolia TaxID=168488 RepID=A0AAV6XZP7_9LAMI|nr:hypothetical protein BUALT_Bualt03G0056500 [Buddleja alternifolia]